MRRRSEHERQHPDPANFVDERRDGSAEAHDKEQCRQTPVDERVLHSVVVRKSNDRGTCSVIRHGMATRHDEHRPRHDQIDRRRRSERSRQPRHLDEHEAREQDPRRRTQAVREVQQGNRAARPSRGESKCACRHQRKGRAKQHGLWQNEQRRNEPLHRRVHRTRTERRKERVIRRVRRPEKDVVKHEADDTHRELDRGVPQQRVTHALRSPPNKYRPGRHAAKENREDEHLRVCAMPDKEPEVACPDRFVDKSGSAGEHKHDTEEEQHGATTIAGPAPSRSARAPGCRRGARPFTLNAGRTPRCVLEGWPRG